MFRIRSGLAALTLLVLGATGVAADVDFSADNFAPYGARTIGPRKVLVIIWEPWLPGNTFHPTAAEVDRALFGSRPSTKDYFRESSGGKMTFERAGVLGPFNALKPAAHYWGEHADPQSPGYDPFDVDGDGWLWGHNEKYAEAVRLASGQFNYAAYDTNGDGVLSPTTELAILIAIPQGSDNGFMRPSPGREFPAWQPLVVDGKTVPWITEWYMGPGLSIATPTHELAHLIMDATDMYNCCAFPRAPMMFSLMDQHWPVGHMDPFHKLKQGWLHTKIVRDRGVYKLRDVETRREVLVVYDPQRGPGEYFLIENRWRGSTYDGGAGGGGGIPRSGLAVWHILDNPALHSLVPWASYDGWGRKAVLLEHANGGVPLDPNLSLHTFAGSRHYLSWMDGTDSGIVVVLESDPASTVNVRVEGSIYPLFRTDTHQQAEDLAAVAKSSDSRVLEFHSSGASGGMTSRLKSNATGDYVTHAVFVPSYGWHRVKVGVRKSNSYGRFQLAIAPDTAGPFTNQGGTVDLYSSSARYQEVDLGLVFFDNTGDHYFRFRVSGRNSASSGYALNLDYVRLIPE